MREDQISLHCRECHAERSKSGIFATDKRVAGNEALRYSKNQGNLAKKPETHFVKLQNTPEQVCFDR